MYVCLPLEHIRLSNFVNIRWWIQIGNWGKVRRSFSTGNIILLDTYIISDSKKKVSRNWHWKRILEVCNYIWQNVQRNFIRRWSNFFPRSDSTKYFLLSSFKYIGSYYSYCLSRSTKLSISTIGWRKKVVVADIGIHK